MASGFSTPTAGFSLIDPPAPEKAKRSGDLSSTKSREDVKSINRDVNGDHEVRL